MDWEEGRLERKETIRSGMSNDTVIMGKVDKKPHRVSSRVSVVFRLIGKRGRGGANALRVIQQPR